MRFWKGNALGNDYIVLDVTGTEPPSTGVVRGLCDRHTGVGSDGVLAADVAASPVRLRIFNPDGTEAEKSGNGLRILGAWLHGRGLVSSDPFDVALPSETVRMRVLDTMPDGARVLSVAMGRASFRAGDVGYTDADPDDEVMGRPIDAGGDTVPIHLVSMGNPHCVALVDTLDTDRFRRVAPAIQAMPAFAHGINVQLARIAGPRLIDAMVWERGAGETAASGSSACAIAAAARRVGAIHPGPEDITIRMPGGELSVSIDDDWRATLTGPAIVPWHGEVDPALVARWTSEGAATSGSG